MQTIPMNELHSRKSSSYITLYSVHWTVQSVYHFHQANLFIPPLTWHICESFRHAVHTRRWLSFHTFPLLSMALLLCLLHSRAAVISRSVVSMAMTMICRSSTVKYFNILRSAGQSRATSGSAKKNMALVLTFPLRTFWIASFQWKIAEAMAHRNGVWLRLSTIWICYWISNVIATAAVIIVISPSVPHSPEVFVQLYCHYVTYTITASTLPYHYVTNTVTNSFLPSRPRSLTGRPTTWNRWDADRSSWSC